MDAELELERARQRCLEAKAKLKRTKQTALEEFNALKAKIAGELPSLKDAHLLGAKEQMSRQAVQEAEQQRLQAEEHLLELLRLDKQQLSDSKST